MSLQIENLDTIMVCASAGIAAGVALVIHDIAQSAGDWEQLH